jgi:oligopeptide/dipeptide ABC transporter ATP-binding protein
MRSAIRELPPPGFMERPPISQMEAPKGFMVISSSQALMEYAKPLMEKNAESLDELNQRMELASSLWNLDLLGRFIEQEKPPFGCRFYPRCTRRIDRCFQEEPELAPISEGHEAACFRCG